jgi:hypothetical protein
MKVEVQSSEFVLVIDFGIGVGQEFKYVGYVQNPHLSYKFEDKITSRVAIALNILSSRSCTLGSNYFFYDRR